LYNISKGCLTAWTDFIKSLVMKMDLLQKLTILTASAKYDVACTSSGADRPGHTVAAGCCHSFAADGRCISLLKILL